MKINLLYKYIHATLVLMLLLPAGSYAIQQNHSGTTQDTGVYRALSLVTPDQQAIPIKIALSEYATYRIVDRDYLREYSKQYQIKRNKRFDMFGYEMERHASFNTLSVPVICSSNQTIQS